MRDATCRREKSQVTFDGEIRPRIECRGFDLTLPNGPHDRQARILPLLRRLNSFFIYGHSAAEILPGELVLLLGQFQRIGLLPLGVELGLQGRDLLFQCFDLGIALRSGVEALHLPLHDPVGFGGPQCGIVRRYRLLGRFEPVVQQRERVVAECHHASLLLLLAAELFRGFAFVADGSLRFAVRDRRVDPRGSLLGLDGCRPEYEPQHDEEDASEDRREEQHLAFALPLELRRGVIARILVFYHNVYGFRCNNSGYPISSSGLMSVANRSQR